MSAVSPASLQTIRTGAELRAAVLECRRLGESVGLVPTMGALHAGHLSLVERARASCDRVAASIFVNPTQFGPNEDFASYPRDFQRDLGLLAERGVDWAFVPEDDAIFRTEHSTFVDVGAVAEPWEGSMRPGHFRGVATVVLKLFQLAPADVAFFGQKDYQQTLVVRKMAADLDLPIEIEVCPTVREADGVAMSSRNANLSSAQRAQATALWQSLQLAESMFASGERDASKIRAAMSARLRSADLLKVDYVALLQDGTVEEVEQIDGPVVAVVAGRLGTTRLIDNLRIG